MDNGQATKMPKPFDSDIDLNASASGGNQQQFVLREDDRLKQEEDYRQELMKVQDEIITLRQVLGAKLKREHELKTLLGVGLVDDIKQDWNETVSDIKSSVAYQKTAETFNAASEKLAPTLQTVNSTFKSGIGSLRNSSYFKTFESTLGSTVSAVKSKIAPSRSTMSFDDNEPIHGASAGSMSTSATHGDHFDFGGNGSDGKK
ncbi:unnamed protein product [Rotaria socialis]|uniref:Tumor protein D54 n=3 Tax=Rotaria socialis TaxID=392032 RepID=A0A820QDT7_9BILA|nr:unnamed protein product [Rotaria socialis]CAF3383492.1 unnamed protein product [Rotaria socialis]CAF3560116.1 unnamed protein product [Rotaria socialis]CAF3699707.1 unnamed protein product [Rotaria socialis]CAF3701193.1 unnamed protein product [Rotaria socialis]